MHANETRNDKIPFFHLILKLEFAVMHLTGFQDMQL